MINVVDSVPVPLNSLVVNCNICFHKLVDVDRGCHLSSFQIAQIIYKIEMYSNIIKGGTFFLNSIFHAKSIFEGFEL